MGNENRPPARVQVDVEVDDDRPTVELDLPAGYVNPSCSVNDGLEVEIIEGAPNYRGQPPPGVEVDVTMSDQPNYPPVNIVTAESYYPQASGVDVDIDVSGPSYRGYPPTGEVIVESYGPPAGTVEIIPGAPYYGNRSPYPDNPTYPVNEVCVDTAYIDDQADCDVYIDDECCPDDESYDDDRLF